jgi:predicted HAD superfamily Cof-like phosphohydrolase
MELQYAKTNIDALDAITDILYVLLGTAHAYGLGDKLQAAFNEVHRSNMTKVMPYGKVLMRKDGKIIKPPTYEKPNLELILLTN